MKVFLYSNNPVVTVRDENGCDATRFTPSCHSLLDIVLSCEGSAPPQRISQVVLDSLTLRDDLSGAKQSDSPSDDAGVEIGCRGAERDAGNGAHSNSASIHVHHLKSTVAMRY